MLSRCLPSGISLRIPGRTPPADILEMYNDVSALSSGGPECLLAEYLLFSCSFPYCRCLLHLQASLLSFNKRGSDIRRQPIPRAVGEGFDFPRLDTLIMATPVSFRSVVEQYAGRLNRDYQGKQQVIIYDYIDSHIPMFRKMYMKRLKAYKQIGYEICGDLKSESQMSESQISENQIFTGHKRNTIFDGGNYQETLKADLLSAAKNIIISSPAISGQKVYELIALLKERQETGVDVTIITWAPDSYGYGEPSYWMQLHEDMRQAGFFVKTAEEFCDRFAVIDQDLVWYGSMNLLAKEQIEDSMLRVHGKEIAAELLETALGRRG